MLGWLTNAEVVGLYTVASTLAMIMSTLHSSLVSIFKPLASKIYRNNSRGDMQEMYLFISKWVGGLNGIVLLTFSGSGTWILAVFSPEYSNLTTYYVLVILSTLYYAGTWIGPTGALLQMTDGHRIEFLNTSIFVAVNIGLNFVLIEIYGIIGAAIATFASSLLTNIIRACEIYYINSFLPFRKDNIVLLAITVVGLLSVIKIGPSVVGMGVSSFYILIITLYMIYSISKKERRVFASLSDNIY
jgi:O-antigen/teichoic acid export membrane protein